MRYEGKLYRPPSESDAYIVQATIGCSWNACVYCDMYRDKTFRVRALDEVLDDVRAAGARYGARVEKVFVADGDALTMPMEHWLPLLEVCRSSFPALRRVSCYAMARNVIEKGVEALTALRAGGLSLLYVGPESGDDVTLKRIAKGQDFAEHVEAARIAKAADVALSVIFLLGAGGTERSDAHARASARLATAMDPAFVSALTLTVVPETPLATLVQRGRCTLPAVPDLLRELRTFVAEASPTDAVCRTNHASNYLPLGGRLPHDRDRIVALLDAAIEGNVRLRPESSRGL